MSLSYINPQSNPGTLGPAFPLVLPLTTKQDPPVIEPVVETPHELQKDESVPYAELTQIRVDEKVKNALAFYAGESISRDTVSVRVVRIVNLNAKLKFKKKEDVIELRLEMVEKFAIDRFIRDRLKIWGGVKEASEATKIPVSSLSNIITGRTKAISKVRAGALNRYYKKLGLPDDMFDSERIYRLAIDEDFSQTTLIWEKTWKPVEKEVSKKRPLNITSLFESSPKRRRTDNEVDRTLTTGVLDDKRKTSLEKVSETDESAFSFQYPLTNSQEPGKSKPTYHLDFVLNS